jgi:RNA polymerase sigma factor (sigma-70 family)
MHQLKPAPTTGDDLLILAIQSGGPDADRAIMTLYNKYYNDVRAVLQSVMTRYGHEHTDPSDILHDSFLIMLYKIQHRQCEITAAGPFWSGIARYHWMNQLKRLKNVSYVTEPEQFYGHHTITPENLIIFNERYKLLDQCLCKCGIRCREILLLWLQDYTMKEIADHMKLSGPAMARKIKHECFKKLKNLITDRNILRS